MPGKAPGSTTWKMRSCADRTYARHFGQLRVHVADAVDGVNVGRKERPERDQKATRKILASSPMPNQTITSANSASYGLLPVDATVVTSMQGVATWLSDVGVIPSPVDVSKSVASGLITSSDRQP